MIRRLLTAIFVIAPLLVSIKPLAAQRDGAAVDTPTAATLAARRKAAEDKREQEANRRYRVGIGASFDFLNGLSAKDLYGDVSIRIPELFRVPLFGRSVGIDAGLYNGRATSLRETNDLTRTFRFPGPASDSTTVVRQSIQRTSDVHHDNLTLYASPTLRFNPNVALALHAEVHRLDRVETVGIRTLTLDTTVEVRGGGDGNGPPTLPRDTTRTTRVSGYGAFFGGGPLINFDDVDYNFWHKPLIGVEVIDGELRGAFAVQFRLTDYDHGFKLGGEVRGPLTFDRPSIAVFLARDFSLGRLADFLVGGNGDDDGEPPDTGAAAAQPATAAAPAPAPAPAPVPAREQGTTRPPGT